MVLFWSKKDPNHILNDKDLPNDLVIPLKVLFTYVPHVVVNSVC